MCLNCSQQLGGLSIAFVVEKPLIFVCQFFLRLNRLPRYAGGHALSSADPPSRRQLPPKTWLALVEWFSSMLAHQCGFSSEFNWMRPEPSGHGLATTCKKHIAAWDFFWLECGRFSSKARSLGLNKKGNEKVHSCTHRCGRFTQKTGSVESKCTSPGQKCVFTHVRKTPTSQPKSKKTEPGTTHAISWGENSLESPHRKMKKHARSLTSLQTKNKHTRSRKSKSRSGVNAPTHSINELAIYQKDKAEPTAAQMPLRCALSGHHCHEENIKEPLDGVKRLVEQGCSPRRERMNSIAWPQEGGTFCTPPAKQAM